MRKIKTAEANSCFPFPAYMPGRMPVFTTVTKGLVAMVILMLLQLRSYSQCDCTMAPSSGSILTQPYSSSAGWTFIDNTGGTMAINNEMQYLLPAGGGYNKAFSSVPGLSASSLSFVAEAKVCITGGNTPGHYIMAFTQNNNDPISFDGGGGNTNNDGIFVFLQAQGEPTGNPDPNAGGQRWQFVIGYKDGTVLTFFPTLGINMLDVNPFGCYYVRLVRKNCKAYLQVSTFATFGDDIPGSPVCIDIPNSVNDFNFLQQGVITFAGSLRRVAMTVDDMKISPYTGGCTFPSTSGCQVNQFCKYIQRVGFKDNGAAIESTPDGGFVVVGSMEETATDRDLYFAKFDAAYNLVPGSRKRIGDNTATAIFTDVGYSIVVAPDAYFVIGESKTTGASPNTDVFVARINSTTFALDWANRYNGGKNEAGIEAVLTKPATGPPALIITGQTNSSSASYDIFALKINTTAALQGSIIAVNTYKVLNGSADEYGTGIIKLTNLNEYVISGRYISGGNEDIICFKISDNLALLPGNAPFRTAGANNDYAFGMEEINNNIYLMGKTATWGTGTNEDVYVMEINKSTLVPTNSRTFSITPTSNEAVYKGQKTTDGNLVMVGDYYETSPNVTPTKGLIMKIRILPGGLGHMQNMWRLALSNANSNAIYNVSESGPNHVVVTGKYGLSTTDEELFISRVNDIDPTATSCCYKPPVMSEGSGKNTMNVTIDPLGANWTNVTHKKEAPVGSLVALCEDYTLPVLARMNLFTTSGENDLVKLEAGSGIIVNPNPTGGLVTVKLANRNETISQVKVTDVNGRIIKVKVAKNIHGPFQLDLSKEPAGTYFLEINTNSQRIISKISVQR